MRKFLVAVCLVSAFTFIADTASARARIGRIGSSKPAPVKTVPKLEAGKAVKAAEQPATPRTWIVAMPRPASQPAAAPVAAAADIGGDEELATTWADMPSAEPAAAAAATDAAPVEPAASPPEKLASVPQAPTRVAEINTMPAPKPVRAKSTQPYEFAICYWNRAGQCVR